LTKKPGLSLEQHEKLGFDLYEIHRRLHEIHGHICKIYPGDICELAHKACHAVDEFRNRLDNKVCSENPKKTDANEIYYRAHRDDDPKRD